MKELTKLQLKGFETSAKANIQAKKPLLNKLSSLEKRRNTIQEEMDILQAQLQAFDQSMTVLTGGYTAEQVLHFIETGEIYEHKTEGASEEIEEEGSTEKAVEEMINDGSEDLPFGNPPLPTEAIN